MKIVAATKNQGKLKELINAFADLPVEIISLAEFGDLPDAVEDGATFEANAVIKARFYMEQTGAACLADDSGLTIDALDGAPGVYSARYCGHHGSDADNNAHMLAELARVGAKSSPAAYECALAIVMTDGTTLTAAGSCRGTIRPLPQGSGGFGYDPYFYIDEKTTLAELTLAEKDKISHRGAALRAMRPKLAEYLKAQK